MYYIILVNSLQDYKAVPSVDTKLHIGYAYNVK